MSWKVQPPAALRALFPHTLWRQKGVGKTLYLTFDDGPVEKETTWVMQLLEQYQLKATFFCVGENAHKNEGLLAELLKKGHSVGNHAYNHLPAWRCSREAYFDNIEKAKPHIPGRLFRPPHGQLYPWYMRALKEQFKHIVMWDVLSMDYDNRLSQHEVLANVMNHVRDGSILLFHDSKKAWKRMHYALPAALDQLLEQGYQFEPLEM
ncbi:polysaccharide deacetylase family protein [Carboxylicivirga mesophila]|uniref:Polysaccharide deacetylase family protein n=1 Tax=Carboxylicivirga mesophila TaxID=1166478 RepID=A0ABS5K555_9BACT|nr:polysaccharide deacetylase family protein [Carboxylicivirga mesophila]MBS2210130.1 polysaccharide deacetylase family protein [Carboxylicivirga mesophila]